MIGGKMEKRTFSINPSTNMIDVLGHAGYTFPFAIADLIDNSIAAKAKNVLIYLDLLSNEPFLFILDDGKGMSKKKLEEAAIIGHTDISESRGDSDLGRYSTGLKSATSSFAGNLIVCSKEINSPINIMQLDYNHMKKSNCWEAYWQDDFEYSHLIKDSGTIVYCDKLRNSSLEINKSNVYAKIDELEIALSHIFGKYILEGRLAISIQTPNSKAVKLKGWSPFKLVESKSTKMVYNIDYDYKKTVISVKCYVLPVFANLSNVDQLYMKGKGLLEQQGFYIYRNDRLIQEGGWLDLPNIDLDPKSNYARIEVNISSKLDEEFKVNFCKNTIVVPEDLIFLFKDIANKTRKASRDSLNYKKHPELKKVLKSEEEKIWSITNSSKGLVLSINDKHPVLVDICEKLTPNERKKLFTIISNSIPVIQIQSQETVAKEYTEKELIVLMNDMYKKFLNEGFSLKEIKSKFARLEPFKDYRDIMISFFDALSEGKQK